ncbi:MAG: hypothetical protein EOP87_15780 [Verrucomicrobiaceae bacterium]|nr:MAG: hypothetical protein EOP87_15780 [Verrucomicrobiaceae bacterium]
MKFRSCPSKTLLPLLSIGALLALPSASAAVIYQHDFGGSSENSLNTVALGTANSTLGGSAGATWLATSGRYLADGTITAGGAASAYVPFSPVSGYQYTITLSVDITSASSTNWIVLSLLNGTPNTAASFNTVNSLDAVSTTHATIGRRYSTVSGSNGTDLLRWQGPGTGGTTTHLNEPQTGVWDISILLNTTDPANWTYQWLMEAGTDVEHLSASYDLGTNSISHIMVSNNANVSGTLSGFSVAAIPEPGLTLLSSLGTGLLTLRRTRRG